MFMNNALFKCKAIPAGLSLIYSEYYSVNRQFNAINMPLAFKNYKPLFDRTICRSKHIRSYTYNSCSDSQFFDEKQLELIFHTRKQIKTLFR